MAVNPLLLNTIDYLLCRLCLQRPGFIKIFQNDDLPKNIFTVTNVKVCNTDPLPNKLCENCYAIVQLAITFRELVSRKNKHLYASLNRQLNLDNKMLMVKSPTVEVVETIIIEDYQDHEPNHTPNDSNTETNEIINQSVIKVRNDLFQQNKETPKVTEEHLIISEQGRKEKDLESTNLETSNITEVESNILEQGKEDKDLESTNRESHNQSHKSTQHSKKRKMKNDTEILSHATPVQVKVEEKPSKRIKYEDELIFKCDICSKYFETSKKLYLHNRLHNKTHLCEIAGCGKKFATKGDLQKHSRTHTGEKPFECKICKKKFAQNVSLRSHRECVHGIKEENFTDENRVSQG